METRKLTHMALLTAIALTIFMVEAQIPNPIPIQGVKLGLANIVTVYAIFTLGAAPALMILVVRVVLGSIFAGQMMALWYSMAGGFLCWLAMLGMRRLAGREQLWVCSVVGAVFHNVGQILVAILVTGTPALVIYFPVLLVSGMLAGLFTGVCAQALLRHMDRLGRTRR